MKDQRPFELPEQLLLQLNETTLAFVLCYVDGQGNPQIVSQSDNFAFFLALQSTLRSWIEAHDMISRDMNASEIVGDNCHISDDKEEDD